MDNYKIVAVRIIQCLWSEEYSSYVVSSGPENITC
jgi:hypothetical protein